MISAASASLLRRAAVDAARSAVARRPLSMACAESVNKLNGLLEEYRQRNYAMEMPRRFQKDVVHAATINSRQLNVPAVSAEGIENVLQNIGMAHRITRSELEGIVSEVGECPLGDDDKANCVISENQMMDLISRNWEEHHQDQELA